VPTKKAATKTIVRNRKAFHEYEVMDRFEAGMALVGTEVKSIRLGKVKLSEAFCQINDNLQLDLCQMEVSSYDYGNIHNHTPDRKRKLLMHRREIAKIYSKIREKGLTLIPLSLYFKNSRVKVEIALCRGKKLHDKRASLKDRDAKRDINRAMKNLD
jgi:SsrA-binding protein